MRDANLSEENQHCVDEFVIFAQIEDENEKVERSLSDLLAFGITKNDLRIKVVFLLGKDVVIRIIDRFREG